MILSLRLLAALPLRVLRSLGALFGLLYFAGSPRWRQRRLEHATQAGFTGLGFHLRSAARAGSQVAELPWVWLRSQQAVARVRCTNEDLLKEAEGGILFITPHLGAFELTARWYAQRFAPITVLYKPPRHASWAHVLESIRPQPNLSTAPATLKGVRQMLRALKAGEAVGLLPDQVPHEGEAVEAPFFGRAAWTMTLPHRLVAATQARVILAWAVPEGPGWRLHLRSVEPEVWAAQTDQEAATVLNRLIETAVRADPLDYAWAYRRYKAPRGTMPTRRSQTSGVCVEAPVPTMPRLAWYWMLRVSGAFPAWLRTRLGRALGAILFLVARKRRKIAERNIALCFPRLAAAEQRKRVWRHFLAFGQVAVDRGLLWFGSPKQIRQQVEVHGLEQLNRSEPVLLLAPHLLGLDAGWTRLTLEGSMASMYQPQRPESLDRLVRAGRSRFSNPVLVNKRDGIRPLLRELKQRPVYYLPDMDPGSREAVFLTFFGVCAASITAPIRIARSTGAVILPTLTYLQPDGRYRVEILSPWRDNPEHDLETAAQSLNHSIEAWVERAPEQYLWVHQRFKTQPPGTPSPYDSDLR